MPLETVHENAEKQQTSEKPRRSAGACFCIVLIVLSLLLRVVCRRIPGFADRYAEIVNPIAVNTLGRLSNLVPFSIAEWLLIALILWGVFSIVRFAVILIMPDNVPKTDLSGTDMSGTKNAGNPPDSMTAKTAMKTKKERLLIAVRSFGRQALVIFTVLLCLFEINEDVYFARTRFAVRYGLERDGYTDEELSEVCRRMVERINALAPLVERKGDVRDRIRTAMSALGEEYPELAGWYPRPKPVFFATVLSRFDITGIYSMFTVEANYNRDIPPYNLPFTMAHELSHLKGWESEKEANFLGWLACTKSQDPDISYSGAMLGWVYCGNELYRRNKELWRSLADEICPAAAADLEDNNLYWDRYKGKPAETMREINDAYLKTEGLAEGFASYDLVTDMIVTYELKRY